ncbi:hypothetical protein QCA50_016133 [Cerrena zonata]|uniref:Aldos-2-ulose dehydratase/isomerase (AUDH) Cupin domain-containing protein n=1 Tax=Cerrena zonata TaxID=2478898 RepID=A0AAW0FTF7_9APHY
MTNQTIDIAADSTGQELIFRVPHPSTVHAGHQVVSPPFWQLVGRSLSLAILPPSGTFTFSAQATSIKVLYGQVTLFDEKNDITETRGIAPSAKSVWSTLLAGRMHLAADAENGTVFLIIESIDGEWQGPFKARNQIISRNILPAQLHIHGSARKVDFSFVQVEELDWQPEGMWDKFLYYNARGFSVRFHGTTSENLVHVQAWALGVGETVCLTFFFLIAPLTASADSFPQLLRQVVLRDQLLPVQWQRSWRHGLLIR